MTVVLSVSGMHGLVRAGVPADPPADAPDSEYALTLQRVMNLISTPDLFFSMNPMFLSLKDTVDRSLKSLLKAGIISYADQKTPRKGCGGCARRTLLSFALQFSARFQALVLLAAENDDTRGKMASELRSYLLRKNTTELKSDSTLVLYARLKTGDIRKIVL